MDELTAILSRIILEPDEDTHRLVYADRLQERGQSGDDDRAEFIRVQVALARPVVAVLNADDAWRLNQTREYKDEIHYSVDVLRQVTDLSQPNCKYGLPRSLFGVDLVVDPEAPSQGFDTVEAIKHAPDRSEHAALRHREVELFPALYQDTLPGPFVPNLDGHVGRPGPHAHYVRGFVDRLFNITQAEFAACADALVWHPDQPCSECRGRGYVRKTDVHVDGVWQYNDEHTVKCSPKRRCPVSAQPVRRVDLVPPFEMTPDWVTTERDGRLWKVARWPGVVFQVPPDTIRVRPIGAPESVVVVAPGGPVSFGDLVASDAQGRAVRAVQARPGWVIGTALSGTE